MCTCLRELMYDGEVWNNWISEETISISLFNRGTNPTHMQSTLFDTSFQIIHLLLTNNYPNITSYTWNTSPQPYSNSTPPPPTPQFLTWAICMTLVHPLLGGVGSQCQGRVEWRRIKKPLAFNLFSSFCTISTQGANPAGWSSVNRLRRHLWHHADRGKTGNDCLWTTRRHLVQIRSEV